MSLSRISANIESGEVEVMSHLRRTLNLFGPESIDETSRRNREAQKYSKANSENVRDSLERSECLQQLVLVLLSVETKTKLAT